MRCGLITNNVAIAQPDVHSMHCVCDLCRTSGPGADNVQDYVLLETHYSVIACMNHTTEFPAMEVGLSAQFAVSTCWNNR